MIAKPHHVLLPMAGVSLSLALTIPIAVPKGAPSDPPNLQGVWVLNRDLSDNPERTGPGGGSRERPGGRGPGGSGPGGMGPGGGGPGGGGPGGGGMGGRGGRRGPGGGGMGGGMGRGGGGRGPGGGADPNARERMMEVMRLLRDAPERLTIVQNATELIVTDGDGISQTLRPDGKKVKQKLANGLLEADRKTRWEDRALVTELDLGDGLTFVQSYTLDAERHALVITSTMKNDRKNDRMGRNPQTRRVYEMLHSSFQTAPR